MAANKKPRKAYRPRHVNRLAVMTTIKGVAWIDQAEIDYRTSRLNTAVDAATRGAATREHWGHIVDAANLLEALVITGVAQGSGINSVQQMFDSVLTRKKATGSAALTFDERKCLQELRDVYCEQIPHLTNRDLFEAEALVISNTNRALAGINVPGTRVLKSEELA
jgi:hypothetical protein